MRVKSRTLQLFLDKKEHAIADTLQAWKKCSSVVLTEV